MKTILIFPRNATDTYATHAKLAASHGWNLQIASHAAENRDAAQFMDFWHPDGCIVNNDRLDARLFEGIPTVFTHRTGKDIPPTSLCIAYDEDEVARLAARELLQLHCASYAYIPKGGNELWDFQRQTAFQKVLETNFQDVHVFAPPPYVLRHHRFLSALSKHLASLPRPVGVFAASDVVAEAVLGACHHAKLDIPKDVAVVGVDNTPVLCEAARPTLTSIAFDNRLFTNSFFPLLVSHVESRRPFRRREIIVPPSGIVRRASTRNLVKSDPHVAAALELIRLKGGEGLAAREVAATFPCGRRMAELRFRAATGRSILEEILAVRQERAQQLRASGIKDEVVAQMCGYSARSSLHRLLGTKRTGAIEANSSVT